MNERVVYRVRYTGISRVGTYFQKNMNSFLGWWWEVEQVNWLRGQSELIFVGGGRQSELTPGVKWTNLPKEVHFNPPPTTPKPMSTLLLESDHFISTMFVWKFS